MHSSVAVGASALLLGSFLQLCPAPPVVIAAGITASGAVIGGAISTAGKMKRQDLPPGVPQQDYDRCFDELRTANVVVSGPVGNNGKYTQSRHKKHRRGPALFTEDEMSLVTNSYVPTNRNPG
jgi:hypothetical protein